MDLLFALGKNLVNIKTDVTFALEKSVCDLPRGRSMDFALGRKVIDEK